MSGLDPTRVEYWREVLAGYRVSAKQQYAEVRLCEQWARDTEDEEWATRYLRWAGEHRRHAVWCQQMARQTMAHIKKLWPDAATADATDQGATVAPERKG